MSPSQLAVTANGRTGYDILLHDVSATREVVELLAWVKETETLHEFVPDYHRLQLERWLWDKLRGQANGRVMDVGVYNPRRWIGDGYFTFGEYEEDVRGSLLALPFPDATLDVVVLTEVLEHCPDPFRAVAEVHRVLAPGGRLFVTSPFLWPWHGTADYHDYWRFTHQGWQLLLHAFAAVTIAPCHWTQEGGVLYDLLRRFEGFGFTCWTHGATGYLCEATK